jgi:5-(carboxyamino)imidazole ribonucleotide mutase
LLWISNLDRILSVTSYRHLTLKWEKVLSTFKHEVEFGGTGKALVGVVMGSRSDWAPCMYYACEALDKLEIPFETGIVSAHRTPRRLFEYGEQAAPRGLRVIIAGAGGAAHLPGMLSSETHLPVLGVPVQSSAFSGLDSLLSIVQMPAGIPTATFSIGKAGATNAGLFAARILASSDAALKDRLIRFIADQTASVPTSVSD